MGHFMSDNLVYSTATGKITPKKVTPEFTGDGIIRITRETKGRKGKGMTVVSGINPLTHDLKTHCKKLKQLCGCGGAVKEQNIEIQGDVRSQAKQYFEALGLTVKLAGG